MKASVRLRQSTIQFWSCHACAFSYGARELFEQSRSLACHASPYLLPFLPMLLMFEVVSATQSSEPQSKATTPLTKDQMVGGSGHNKSIIACAPAFSFCLRLDHTKAFVSLHEEHLRRFASCNRYPYFDLRVSLLPHSLFHFASVSD